MIRSVLKPQVHESGAHLLFANPDDPDDPGLGRYFGIVGQFDRAFELANQNAAYEAADETWRFNHNPADKGPSINYWKRKIEAIGQDYDAYYEYNIPLVAVDDTGEKKTIFSSDPASQLQYTLTPGTASNHCPKISRKDYAFKSRARTATQMSTPRFFAQCFGNSASTPLPRRRSPPWNRLLDLAFYVRIDSDVNEEHIVDRNSLLERLARFSSTRSGVGESKWDNQEIIDHRTAIAMNPTSLNKFYSGHQIGKPVKILPHEKPIRRPRNRHVPSQK